MVFTTVVTELVLEVIANAIVEITADIALVTIEAPIVEVDISGLSIDGKSIDIGTSPVNNGSGYRIELVSSDRGSFDSGNAQKKKEVIMGTLSLVSE